LRISNDLLTSEWEDARYLGIPYPPLDFVTADELEAARNERGRQHGMNEDAKTPNLAAALVKVQAELEPVKRNHRADIPTKGGGSYSYSYASLEDVFACSRHILTKHGLAVTHFLCETPSGRVGVKTILMHESGEEKEGVLPLVGENMTMQALGSALTYARRYGYQSAVGIAAEDDDDAQGAMPSRTAPAQAESDEDEAPKGYCPVHNVPFVHRVGVSKPKQEGEEGKPYDFWGCPTKVGGGWCKQKPPKEPTEEEQSVLDSEPPAEEPPSDLETALLDVLRDLGAKTGKQKHARMLQVVNALDDFEGLPSNWANFPPDRLNEAVEWLRKQPRPESK
jgi:hypothetical protein